MNHEPPNVHKSHDNSGSLFAGFFITLLIAVCFMFISVPLFLYMKAPVLIAISTILSGPLSGFIFWVTYQKTNSEFAHGALIFAVVSFLLTGTCWLTFFPAGH